MPTKGRYMLRHLFILGLFLFIIISVSEAQTFGELVHRGTGCPEGTVGISPSPDNKVLSIIFDAYQVEVPQYNQNNDNAQVGSRGVVRRRNDPTLDHKACALSFTSHLPAGVKVDSIDIILNVRGATMLDIGTEGSFSAALVGYNGLATQRGRTQIIERKLFRASHSPVDTDWSSLPTINIPISSNCAVAGANEISFDLKTHLQAEILSQDLSKKALLFLDSVDAEGLIKVKLNTSPCSYSTQTGVTPSPRRRPRYP
jgi:hypothetical protein